MQAAAAEGHLEVVKFLLDRMADVNAKPASVGGLTVLRAASMGYHSEIVKLVESHGGLLAYPKPIGQLLGNYIRDSSISLLSLLDFLIKQYILLLLDTTVTCLGMTWSLVFGCVHVATYMILQLVLDIMFLFCFVLIILTLYYNIFLYLIADVVLLLYLSHMFLLK